MWELAFIHDEAGYGGWDTKYRLYFLAKEDAQSCLEEAKKDVRAYGIYGVTICEEELREQPAMLSTDGKDVIILARGPYALLHKGDAVNIPETPYGSRRESYVLLKQAVPK